MSFVGESDSKMVQQRLPLRQSWPHDRAHFIVSSCNSRALEAIDSWPNWPGGKLALVGPEGAGKSHLAAIWSARAGAAVADRTSALDASVPLTQPMLIEIGDRLIDEEWLFHLMNRADDGASLLVTSRTPPRNWTTRLPDLRSRLNAMMVVELQGPDDIVLGGMLEKFFRERNISPRKSVLEYLLRRIERSGPAALAAVERIDDAAAANNRNITRDFARAVLGDPD